MRIAIDTIPLLSPLTGVGQYTSHLIRQFHLLSPENDYTYYYGYFTNKLFYGNERISVLKEIIRRIPAVEYSVRKARSICSQFHLRNFDLYFEPNLTPLRIKSKKVVTTVHDFSLLLYPESHPRERVREFSKLFFKNITRSNKIITDSIHVKEEALRFIKLPPEMITAIPLGIEHDVFRIYDERVLDLSRQDLNLPSRFVLFVGTWEPRKNLNSLVRAYGSLPPPIRKEYRLVLVGQKGQLDVFLGQEVAKSIVQLGYLERQKLAHVYSLSSLLVFPSLYEGFGLPPLEAMACGCPVIVSKEASLPEVCGDAAYYVDPKDVDSISEGIIAVLSDETLRKSLIAKGIERAKTFSWEKTARKTLDVFEEVMGMKG